MYTSYAIRRRLTRYVAASVMLAAGLSATLATSADAATGTISLPTLTLLPNGAADNSHATLTKMSCVNSTCMSIGSYEDTGAVTRPYVVVTVNGSVLTSQRIEGPLDATNSTATPVTASDISCVAGITCWVVGSYTTGGRLRPFVTTLTISTTAAIAWIPNALVTNVPLPNNFSTSSSSHSDVVTVKCTSPTFCLLVGQYDTASSSVATFDDVWNGTSWIGPEVLPAPSNALDPGLWVPSSISCWDATDCNIFGEYRVTGSNLEVPMALPVANGVPATPVAVPLPSDASTTGNASSIRHLSSTCFSATSCLLTGSYINNHTPLPYTKSFLDALSGSTWNSTSVPLGPNSTSAVNQTPSSLSCVSATLCVLAGNYASSNGNTSGFWTYGNGAWNTPDVLPGLDGQITLNMYVNTLSCVSSYVCTYSGYVSNQSGAQAAVVGQYDIALPAGVTQVTATQTSAHSATVSWTPPTITGADISTYVVVRTSDGTQICVTSSTSCVDNAVTGGKSYTYKVRSISNDGQVLSGTSVVLNVVNAPATPLHVSATSGIKSVTLKWTAATTGGPVSSYVVVVKQGKSTKTYHEAGSAKSATFGALTAKVAVHITLAATNVAGTSSVVAVTAVPKA